MKAWSERPVEQRTLFNPAFLATLAHETARGHVDEANEALPFASVFLAVPAVLHHPTREALPTIRTSMSVWLQRNPTARVDLPSYCRGLSPFVREALLFGTKAGALKIHSGGTIMPIVSLAALGRNGSPEVTRCRKRAHFMGRWIARAGDPVTMLSLWGLTV
ncbi:three component ABC system middle component [Patulibacter sp. NPDC049589]|uniref:three component ABC system middle component n=1 Tax=Patulibacter sp. NPDC049589 TaxID=3154731 RepID=UPI00341604B5